MDVWKNPSRHSGQKCERQRANIKRGRERERERERERDRAGLAFLCQQRPKVENVSESLLCDCKELCTTTLTCCSRKP